MMPFRKPNRRRAATGSTKSWCEIYARLLPVADRLYLTEIHQDSEGDVLFPEIDPAMWREIAREDIAADGETPAYAFVSLDRA